MEEIISSICFNGRISRSVFHWGVAPLKIKTLCVLALLSYERFGNQHLLLSYFEALNKNFEKLKLGNIVQNYLALCRDAPKNIHFHNLWH